LDRRRDPVVVAEHRRGGAATSAHAFTSDHSAHGSVTARTPRSRRARFGHGAHASVTARTLRSRCARFGHGAHATVAAHVSVAVRTARHGRHCGHSGPSGPGGLTNTARAAERVAKPQAGASESRSSVAGGAARGDGDFGRASGRFTSGRYETRATGPATQRGDQPRRSRRARPQITAVTGADHSDPGDVERAAGSGSAAAAAAAAAAITIPSDGLEVEQPTTRSPNSEARPPACGAGGVR
jgi:hypothetical protein